MPTGNLTNILRCVSSAPARRIREAGAGRLVGTDERLCGRAQAPAPPRSAVPSARRRAPPFGWPWTRPASSRLIRPAADSVPVNGCEISAVIITASSRILTLAWDECQANTVQNARFAFFLDGSKIDDGVEHLDDFPKVGPMKSKRGP